jgi:hypothetical protein
VRINQIRREKDSARLDDSENLIYVDSRFGNYHDVYFTSLRVEDIIKITALTK